MSSPTAAERAPARPPWSLAARLTAWYAGSAFLLLAAATGFLYWALVRNLDQEDDQHLANQVHRHVGMDEIIEALWDGDLQAFFVTFGAYAVVQWAMFPLFARKCGIPAAIRAISGSSDRASVFPTFSRKGTRLAMFLE